MQGKVVLTVPHAVCRNPQRDCDRLAEASARSLAADLAGRVEVVLKIGNVYRPVGDLNRIETRRTPFREDVVKELSSTSLLVDVHSFPATEDWGRGVSSEVVILDVAPNVGPASRWEELTTALQAKDVNALYLQGSKLNDIVVQAHEARVPAVLIEFNEGLAPARLHTITNHVAAALLA